MKTSSTLSSVDGAHGKDDRMVGADEANDFIQWRSRGGPPNKGRCKVSIDTILGAQAAVRKALVASLPSVAIFQSLSSEMIEQLADSMSEAPYDENEYIFDQGEEGDSFFVIIGGQVRTRTPAPPAPRTGIPHRHVEARVKRRGAGQTTNAVRPCVGARACGDVVGASGEGRSVRRECGPPLCTHMCGASLCCTGRRR